MKILIDYFNFVGDKCKSDMASFVLIGILKKKISEHEKSPYRNHEIRDWSRKYSDKNRMYVELHPVKDGIILPKMKYWNHFIATYRTDADKDDEEKRKDSLHRLYSKMIQRFIDDKAVEYMALYNIDSVRKFYLPGYFDIDFRDLP